MVFYMYFVAQSTSTRKLVILIDDSYQTVAIFKRIHLASNYSHFVYLFTNTEWLQVIFDIPAFTIEHRYIIYMYMYISITCTT